MLRSVSIFIAAICISGCASMPPFDAPNDGYGPTVATVVDKIQCEIAEARDSDLNNKVSFQNNIQPFDKWAASVSLTLTVNDTAGTSPGGLPLSYIDPLKFTGTSFSFNASPLLYQTRTRTYVQNYTINIGKIPRGLNCVNSKIQNNGFNLEGNLGLKDQIYMGLHSFSGADKGADFYQPTVGNSKSLDDFGATVSFHIFTRGFECRSNVDAPDVQRADGRCRLYA